jgi:hypothetical protein
VREGGVGMREERKRLRERMRIEMGGRKKRRRRREERGRRNG